MTAKNPTPLTFERAIELSQSLLEKIEKGRVNEAEIESEITSLIETQNGARGFFVVYLTDDRSLADNPSRGVLEALKAVPEFASELLVKNLAMSAAMAVTHSREGRQDMAKQSHRVTRRTANTIQKLSLDCLFEKLKELQKTLATGEGNYRDFLIKWGYDTPQKQAIQKSISEII